jgi:hypothetical protein
VHCLTVINWNVYFFLLKERKKALDSKLLVGRIQKEKQISPNNICKSWSGYFCA